MTREEFKKSMAELTNKETAVRREMRELQNKFAWKKGDVLVSNNGSEVLFEKFNNDEYTEFTGSGEIVRG